MSKQLWTCQAPIFLISPSFITSSQYEFAFGVCNGQKTNLRSQGIVGFKLHHPDFSSGSALASSPTLITQTDLPRHLQSKEEWHNRHNPLTDMLWTCHSHSGQFCTHATSSLREVITAALSRGMTTICLTEHIPRHPAEFYPGEETHALVRHHGSLFALFDAYYAAAVALRSEFADRISVLIGFEGEWISASTTTIMRELRERYDFDLFLGSNHHVGGVAIDFTVDEYGRARDEVGGGSDEGLAEKYFDEQLDMLKELRPPVVAHFDLVRLLADEGNRDRDWRGLGQLWWRVKRNLEFVKGYGGVLEVNAAALRKGLEDVYPRREILEEWNAMGGRCTLSDDSHGVGQLCTNYGRALDCISRAGIEALWCPVGGEKAQAPRLTWEMVPLTQVRETLGQDT
ncbi:hypothetical protein CAC42_1621 [Sphaceloma murrayae]|uniref:Histidinol-phosphatase n=1 Tax=Sphaceloma murrayae TaxID=2082308 RepID=A0A2K1R387_9PEZI|nr:hypothetical protein CAC42_1621 [Sphaceloma murrayae]